MIEAAGRIEEVLRGGPDAFLAWWAGRPAGLELIPNDGSSCPAAQYLTDVTGWAVAVGYEEVKLLDDGAAPVPMTWWARCVAERFDSFAEAEDRGNYRRDEIPDEMIAGWATAGPPLDQFQIPPEAL